MSLNTNKGTLFPTKSGTGRKHGLLLTLIAITTLFTFLVVGCTATGQVSPIQQSNTQTTSNLPSATALYDENTVVSLYQKAISSVVEIKTVVETASNNNGPIYLGYQPPPDSKGDRGPGFSSTTRGISLPTTTW